MIKGNGRRQFRSWKILPLKFAKRGLDSLGQDGIHHKVLEEESLAGVAVPLEHVEVAIVCDLATDGANLFRIEELWRRPLKFFALQVVRAAGPQRATHPTVVNSRQQAQVDLKVV